jgi:bla regulator protein BlaR1
MSDWLLDTLLATSGLVVLVLLLRESVRKRFGSRVTYGLWLIPAARLFMPTLTHTVERRIPAPTSVQPLGEAFVREPLWMARVAPADTSLLDRLGGWPTILVAVWLAAAAVLFFSRMVAFYRDRHAILGSAEEIARLGSVRMVRTPEVASPVALGILDRIIAVPSDFDRRYDERERRLVIEHELAHHRSGDLAVNLFAFVLLCLQWFNPLAWIAHAAFRFDQEAACDARVLDKAHADDRADYARAIAKAASGRALLFASALDRRNSLHRRFKSMLRSSNPSGRFSGRLMIVTGIAVGLPLTASRAVDYVDVPVPAMPPAPTIAHVIPTAAASHVVSRAEPAPLHVAAAASQVVPAVATSQVQPAAGAKPVAAALPVSAAAAATPVYGYDNLTISGDLVTIDGVTKRFKDLTPAEKDRVRAAVAKGREALKNVHIDRDQIMRDLATIPNQQQMAELQRQVARAQASAAVRVEAARRSIAAVDWPRVNQSLADARRSIAAVDWPRVNRSLADARRSTAAADWVAVRRAIAIDPAKIASAVSRGEESVRRANRQLDRIQARIEADQQQ